MEQAMLRAGETVMPRTVAGPLSGISVLIVEDEFLIAVEAQRIVEEAGAVCGFPVNSVETARRHLATQPAVDIAVLDMRLGDEDGGALMADLSDRGIPFVIASGLAVNLGGSAIVVMKPYRDIDLIEAILSTLARR
jgi:DNA-binding NarL/FixJ family response regulator